MATEPTGKSALHQVRDTSVCPICGHMTYEIKCKVWCDRCKRVIENCCGN